MSLLSPAALHGTVSQLLVLLTCDTPFLTMRNKSPAASVVQKGEQQRQTEALLQKPLQPAGQIVRHSRRPLSDHGCQHLSQRKATVWHHPSCQVQNGGAKAPGI